MFIPSKLALIPSAPPQFENNTPFQFPDTFNNFFTPSGHTLSAYPKTLRADTVLLNFFQNQASFPTENFLKMLNFTANFYKNIVNFPQFLGEKTGKHYHFLLGAVNAKKLRYAIASDENVRNCILQLGKEEIPYIGRDFPEFADKLDHVHEIAVHIGILRSELLEVEQFCEFDECDPLVRLFSVCRYLVQENEICEKIKQEQQAKRDEREQKIAEIDKRMENLLVQQETRIIICRRGKIFRQLQSKYDEIQLQKLRTKQVKQLIGKCQLRKQWDLKSLEFSELNNKLQYELDLIQSKKQFDQVINKIKLTQEYNIKSSQLADIQKKLSYEVLIINKQNQLSKLINSTKLLYKYNISSQKLLELQGKIANETLINSKQNQLNTTINKIKLFKKLNIQTSFLNHLELNIQKELYQIELVIKESKSPPLTKSKLSREQVHPQNLQKQQEKLLEDITQSISKVDDFAEKNSQRGQMQKLPVQAGQAEEQQPAKSTNSESKSAKFNNSEELQKANLLKQQEKSHMKIVIWIGSLARWFISFFK